MTEAENKPCMLKVCGMRETDNLQALFALHPDFIGLIFYPGSKRYAAGNKRAIRSLKWPEDIRKVGVFVNEHIAKIRETADEYALQWIQLHGDESAGDCAALKDSGLSVIKSFGIEQSFDFARLRDYEECVDAFLFDTSTSQYGGSGRPFDWDVLGRLDKSFPFILSGGIDIGMEGAIKQLASEMNMVGIDINSRFERSPGVKDIDKIREFQSNLLGLTTEKNEQ